MPPQRSRWMAVLLMGLGAIALMRILSAYTGQFHRPLTYSEFFHLLQNNPATQEIVEARLVDDRVDPSLLRETLDPD